MSDQKKIQRIPWGLTFRDPGHTRRHLQLIDKIRQPLSGRGYERVMPPALDYGPTFRKAWPDSRGASAFDLSGGRGEDLALRPDVTIQVVKGVANQMGGVDFPARLYYEERVFRNAAKSRTDSREIYQVGGEIIGHEDDVSAWSELIIAGLEILDEIRADNSFAISLGHAGFFNAFTRHFRIEGAAKRLLWRALETKDIPDIRQLPESTLTPEVRTDFERTIMSFGNPKELKNLQGRWESHLGAENIRPVFEEFFTTLETLEKAGWGDRVSVDFAMTRDFNYYTGVVFEGFIAGSGKPVLTGGSYNSLFEQFSAEKKKAAGFAVFTDYIEHI